MTPRSDSSSSSTSSRSARAAGLATLRRWVDWLSPDMPDAEQQARARFFLQAWLVAWPFSLMWTVTSALAGVWGQVVLNVLVALLGPIVVLSLRRDRRLVLWSNVSLASALVLYGLGMLTQTPMDETNLGFMIALPLLASFIFGVRGSAVWMVLTAVVSVALVVLGNEGFLLPQRDPTPLLSKTLNIVFAVIMVWLFSARFHAVRAQALWKSEQAARAKNIFLATIGHEIRTPMSGVLGMTEVMLAESHPSAVREQLEVIQRSGRVMVALINDLLDLSKLEDHKLTLERQPFEVDEVLRDVEHLSRGSAVLQGLTLSFARDEAVPAWVEGDALRLRQVLGNLVSNALKFTSAGEVRVRVERAGPGESPAPLRLVVQDTGIGIAPEHLARLFTPFEQADSSTTRRFGGTGLGLALCRELVALMGGRIEVDSRPGAGTTFTVHVALPVAAPRQGVTPIPSADGGVGQVVLVVDDNAINLKVAASLVARAGYTVETAVDGAQALARAQRGGLAAVLMDCHMPVLDGFEATQRIRALPGDAAKVPIVALTASAAPEDLEACHRSGMNAVLAKPVTLAQVSDALQAATTRWTGK